MLAFSSNPQVSTYHLLVVLYRFPILALDNHYYLSYHLTTFFLLNILLLIFLTAPGPYTSGSLCPLNCPHLLILPFSGLFCSLGLYLAQYVSHHSSYLAMSSGVLTALVIFTASIESLLSLPFWLDPLRFPSCSPDLLLAAQYSDRP